ncbi:MAG: dihydroorotate dehydrogenase electron transfer subunit [Oscillospiraceae bacterium]|jgi:dihydroorotate dehydrogenase electron transfer subunit|nr:dihydroorotate dehydrogenase electron transfer subunit [Oscillospiraceae bacterium]
MKEQKFLTVIQNKEIAKNIFLIKLFGEFNSVPIAGQFVNIKINNLYFRRPMSICDFGENILTIIYKIIGKGTYNLSKINSGTKLDVLFPLGNGFNINIVKGNITLIGGGLGLAPLYFLAKTLKKLNKYFKIYAGFRTSGEIFFLKKFSGLGEINIATQDGSFGNKGFVTELLNNLNNIYYFACGPMSMMNAVRKIFGTNGQVSLEERMACGFGACMGCTLKTKSGNKRICLEGPVFEAKDF